MSGVSPAQLAGDVLDVAILGVAGWVRAHQRRTERKVDDVHRQVSPANGDRSRTTMRQDLYDLAAVVGDHARTDDQLFSVLFSHLGLPLPTGRERGRPRH